MLVRPSWMWNDTVEQRWQCCYALALVLTGWLKLFYLLSWLFHDSFLESASTESCLSGLLYRLCPRFLLTYIWPRFYFLLCEEWPPDWEVACIIPLTQIEGNPGAVCWNSCLPFFWGKVEKKQDKIEQQCVILEPPVRRVIVSTAALIRHSISKLEQHLGILNMVEMS